MLLDLTELSAFADYFVIATVDNIRQSRAIVDIVGEKLREHGIKMTFEGDRLDDAYTEHSYFSKEAASGGAGVGGGGCGCN